MSKGPVSENLLAVNVLTDPNTAEILTAALLSYFSIILKLI